MNFLWSSMVFLWFPMVVLWISYGFPMDGFPMVFKWICWDFPCHSVFFAWFPQGTHFRSIFAVFWSPLDPFGIPFGRLRDRPGLTLGSLGTPLDPSDEPLGPPWATFGTPLGPRPKNTQKRRLRLHPFRTPFFSKKNVFFLMLRKHFFFILCF